jgi:hypothetical protein
MPRARGRRAAIVLALFVLAGAARAAVAAPTWLPGPLTITPSGANGAVYSSVLWDPDGNGPEEPRLVVGGAFTSIEGVAANCIAVRNPHTVQWEPLGIGLDNYVFALAVYNGDLIAAGNFAGKIARWDGSAWQPLGAGFNSAVLALSVYSGELYAGGYFTTAGGQRANHIARWNGTTWHICNLGMDGPVWALSDLNGLLFAGGQFSTAGPIFASAIAAWNGTEWTALGAGVSGAGGGVFSLTQLNGELIVAGNFDHAGGITNSRIARWNGSSWQAMGSLGFGPNDVVRALQNNNGDLVAGIAVYISSSGTWDGSFARWNGSSWTTLGTMEDKVECILRYDNEWVVGGQFTYAQSVTANHLARFGTQWAPFGGGSVDHVSALIPFRSRLVAGGSLLQPALNNPANNIVGWDGLNLSSFGTGISGPVSALETFSSTVLHVTTYELIAGGFFTQAGGVAANNIARWDETPTLFGDTPAWQAMGAGFSNGVYAIKRFNGQTYAAGGFLFSGSTRVNYIARWNESTDVWEPLAGGTNGPVYALEVYGNSLYVGGQFTTAGGFATGGLAIWSGTAWFGLGTFPGAVYSLEYNFGALDVGGMFSAPPGGSANLTRLAGNTFYPYSTGMNNAVWASAPSSTGVTFFGGAFTSIGNHIISKGITWLTVDGGTDGDVLALNPFHDEMNVGGSFATVGTVPLASRGWARYSESGVPWIAAEPGSQSVASGADVMLASRPAVGYTGLAYQWYRFDQPLADGPPENALSVAHALAGGSVISGAHSATLGIHNVTQSDAGQYRLVVSNASGSVTSQTITLTVDGITDVPLGDAATRTLFESLGPNPARGAARLAFRLDQAADVRMLVHDVAGRLVRTADVGHLAAGRHTASWDGATGDGVRVGTGLYFVSLDAAGRRIGTRRLVVER